MADVPKFVKVKLPYAEARGENLNEQYFVYDFVKKDTVSKMKMVQDYVQSVTNCLVTKENLIELAVPVLQKNGFVVNDLDWHCKAHGVQLKDPSLLARWDGEKGVEKAVAISHAGEEGEATSEAPRASEGQPEPAKQGRGRRSKYPYATMEIGESFLIDADSVGVTLNHSLINNRGFQLESANGRFKVTRTK